MAYSTHFITFHQLANMQFWNASFEGNDMRAIQTLLGHSDVRTTMIYTHCVPSRTIKDLKSPLDF